MAVKKIFFIMLSVIFFLLFVGMTINVIVIFQEEPLSKSDVTEFSATIKDVTVLKDCGVIEIEEHKKLYVLYIDEVTNLTTFLALQPGQKIYFDVENIWKPQIKEMEFIFIPSLRTDEEEIFTLDDYNESMFKRNMLARIMGIIGSVIFFLLFLRSVFSCKKVFVTKRKR